MTVLYLLEHFKELTFKASYNALEDSVNRMLSIVTEIFNDAELKAYNDITGLTVLWLHYVKGETYVDIACKLGYEKRHIYRLRESGLKLMSEILNIPVQ